MFENINFKEIWDVYLIPWSINIILSILIFFIGRLIIRVITNIITRLLDKGKVDPTLRNFLVIIIKNVLLFFVILAVLDRLGVQTASLIAILGAAGLAIGLALRGTLQNFTSGLLLIIFRPFQIGDYVGAAGVAGIIRGIGIFKTMIRTTDNTLITIPNGMIYSGTITNYTAFKERRVDLEFMVSYEDDLAKAKKVIQDTAEAYEGILLEKRGVRVRLIELAESGMVLKLYAWTKRETYIKVKFGLLEAVKLALDANGITIPYPHMQVYLDQAKSKRVTAELSSDEEA